VQPELQATEMAHVIQLSVAPVFLLSGIGALLSVISSRVGRIVDRSRSLEAKHVPPAEVPRDRRCELELLSRRARLANWASACVRLVRC